MTKSDFESPREHVARVYERHRADIQHFFKRGWCNDEKAEELTRRVYYCLLNDRWLGKVKDPEKHIVMLALDVLQKDIRQSLFENDGEPDFTAVINSARSHTEGADSNNKLWRVALEQLPSEARKVFLLHYVAGVTPEEISFGMGLRLDIVNRRLRQAWAHLHRIFGDVLRPKR